MKRNAVWIVEVYDDKRKRWDSVWNEGFFYTKRDATDVIRMLRGEEEVEGDKEFSYRVRKYVAEDSK